MRTLTLTLGPFESASSEYPASLDVYLRENTLLDSAPIPAVVICPGGGYEFLSSRESEPIALAFLAQGFHAFVLRSTTMADGVEGNFLDATVQQAADAFALIIQHADEWNVDPDGIFIQGCSAGGHLAASYSTQWHELTSLAEGAPAAKPRGTILCYPVISFQHGWPEDLSHFGFPVKNAQDYDTSQRVSNHTPDTFIWHTADDELVPVANSLAFCQKLAEHKVPFEYHVYESGKHGLSLATRATAKTLSGDYIVPNVAAWFPACISWINHRLAAE